MKKEQNARASWFFIFILMSIFFGLFFYSLFNPFIFPVFLILLILLILKSIHIIIVKLEEKSDKLFYYNNQRTLNKIKEFNQKISEKPKFILLDPFEEIQLRSYALECSFPLSPEEEELEIALWKPWMYPRVYLTNQRIIIERADLQIIIPLEKIIGLRLFDENALIPGLEIRSKIEEPWKRIILRIPSADKWKKDIEIYRAERLKEIQYKEKKL